MTTKTRRKRIVKPVIQVKPTDPVIPVIPIIPDKTKEVEFISVPVSPDAISSCDGCHFYDEAESKCNDTENRDCTGLIFVKK